MEYELAALGPDATCLRLRGRADAAAVDGIETAASAQVRGAAGHLVIDLTEVPFMGSLGIRMLISFGRLVTRRGARIAVYGAQAAVLDVFETMALGDLMPIAADQAGALAAVRA